MTPLRNLLHRLNVAWQERAIALKAISFGLVGIVNSAIDFGIFSFAYYYVGLPVVTANTLAWVVAVTGSYVMNSTITFAAESGRRLEFRSYLTFVVSQIAGFLGKTATVWCLVTLASVPAWAAKVAAILGLARRRRIDRLAVRVLVIDRLSTIRRGSGGDDGIGDRMRLRPVAGDERGGRHCDDRSGSAEQTEAVHLSAVTTSLFSSVPFSPCSFAPSESCQRPAMPKVALNR